MLFGVRLANEVYSPWKHEYIAYEKLKKLLKESVVAGDNDSAEWTAQDETRFVSALDEQLEKVFSFESRTYKELEQSIDDIEAKISNTTEETSFVDPKEIEVELEDALELTNQLDRFRRLNFTGFMKIVKKHDRLHKQYQVRPLLQVRLKNLPFQTEDYSPLLYKLSSLYQFLADNFGSQSNNSASAMMSSYQESQGYTTYRFWVHPENIMEVKTRILRHLPVLVYDREDDDRNADADPIVTSLYLDNRNFEIYKSQLEKKRDEKYLGSLRLRWHGRLYQTPDITLEQKFEDHVVRTSLKPKQVASFLEGDSSVITKNVSKMKARNTTAHKIELYEKSARDLQAYVKEHNLQPILRTVYTRTAFEIPGDDNVRILLDSDITFIREDSFNEENPIRDPDSWHRQDLDIPSLSQPLSVLRKSEFSTFPYSVMEVRVKLSGDQKTPSKHAWLEELTSSHLVKGIPLFSKFVHGTATLFAEDDRLDSLPFWLPELEHDIREDPQESYKRNRKILAERQRQQQQSSSSRSASDLEIDEDSSEGEIIEPESSEYARKRAGQMGYPTWTRSSNINPKLDMDSEEEEVVLPPGVKKPENFIKNQGAVKVETKVWLANERTFNKWLSVTTMLSALTFSLYSSVQRSTNTQVAEYVAYGLFALTLFAGLWGYYVYIKRLRYIKQRSEKHLDDPLGPLIVSIGLLLALIINFAAVFNARVKQNGVYF